MKKLLFLGCNKLQLPYLKEAKKLDYFVVGTDINKEPVAKKYLDKFYRVGYEDIDGLLEIGRREYFTDIDKVFTASSQFAHLGASHFSRKFKISYIPVKTINICLNKVEFYKILVDIKVPPAKYHVCQNRKEIMNIIKNTDKNYYLKSDFGKNPFYIYLIRDGKVPRVNFKKDRYLRNSYVLQEEIIGKHIRINYYDDNFIYFVHRSGQSFYCRDKIGKLQPVIEDSVIRVIKALRLQNRFVKFDLILEKSNFYIIDIGIDPPARFRILSNYLGNNFAKNYFLHNMDLEHKYPSVKRMVNANVNISGKGVKRMKK